LPVFDVGEGALHRLLRRWLIEEFAWWHLDSFRQSAKRRNLGIAFASLDPADLGGMNAAAFGDLLLSKPEFFAGSPQIEAEVAHAPDR
jgi:hypothetical protein